MSRRIEGLVEKISHQFQEQDVSKVVLAGDVGAGKTWAARKFCESALRKGLSYGSIWIAPAENPEKKGLLDIIASQLSLSSRAEEWDVDEDIEEVKDNEEMEPGIPRQKILDKLETMRNEKSNNLAPDSETVKEKTKETGKGKYLIVVIDDATEEDEDKIVPELKRILHPSPLKMLITRKVPRHRDASAASDGREEAIQPNDTKAIPLVPLEPGEALALLQERFPEVKPEVAGNSIYKVLAEKAFDTPARVILVAEALKQISRKDGVGALKNAVEDLVNLKGDVPKGVLRFVYKMLPDDVTRSCYWLCKQLFTYRDAVHFNELITYLILEGCFDHHNRIDKAYEEGHCVLMELKDRGMLKGHGNYVYFEKAMLALPDERRNGFSGASKLGLADVLMDNRLGRVILADGMVRTVCRDKKKKEMSMLVVDGCRLAKEVSKEFFGSMKGLKVLAVFNPMFEFLPPGLSELKDLQVLVLRGCQHLKKADEISQLTKLLVLEISGASLLEDIDKEFFSGMTGLKSVNLSGLHVSSIPASLFNLGEVMFLILRECPKFVELLSLRNMQKLQMVDLCGSASFERLSDGTMSTLTVLKTLNISGTKVRNLPILKLGGLTRILLSNCPMLTMIRSLRDTTDLEVLDISGSKGIKDLNGANLQSKSRFRILDVSETGILTLPPTISNLPYVNLRGCWELSKLPLTKALLDLVTLDLSGAVKLVELQDKSFEHLSLLRNLNLSGTEIEQLPTLSHLLELRELVLKDCKRLTKLEGLTPLEKLEVLDISGCCSLTISRDESFKRMSRLKKLDLSATKIESLPHDCFPSNLCHLILRDCKFLGELPSLEQPLSKLEELDLGGAGSLATFNANFLRLMTKLKILNLSKTRVEDLPSLSHLTNLIELSLSGCSCVPSGLEALKEIQVLDLSGTNVRSLLFLHSHTKLRELLLSNCPDLDTLTNLESLTHLEVLNLSRTGLKHFPDQVIHLTYLRKLHLPNLNQIQVDWSKIKHLPADLEWDPSEPPQESETEITALATTESQSPSILVCGTKFFHLLERNPELWDKCFQEFHFSVWLLDEKTGDETMKLPGGQDVSLFKYLNPRRRFPGSRNCSLLEIHGSGDFPGDLKNALGRAEYISVIDNATISSISGFGKECVGSIKTCSFERCPELKCVFVGEEGRRIGERLESLYLHSLPSLERLCDEKCQSGIFLKLKNLHIDYCPELVSIFSSSNTPVNLETLRVKFCKKLEILFEGGEPVECKMPKLKTLELLDLPALKKIGCCNAHSKMVKIESCPNLENGASPS